MSYHESSTWSTEALMLLRCARTDPSEEDVRVIRTLASDGFDGAALLRLSERHRLFPLLYQNLTVHAAEVLPEAFAEALRRTAQAHTRYSLRLGGELVRVADAFDGAGIPLIGLKGPALAARIYGSPTLRQYVDLDLVVPEERVHEAVACLDGLGYRALHQLSRSQFEVLKLWGRMIDLGLVHPARHVHVELHWELTGRDGLQPFDMEEIWRRHETADVFGRRLGVLAEEDLLLYLGIHGTKHAWRRLCWLTDLAQALGQCRDVDWERLLHRAGASGGERMLLLGLDLAARLLGAQLDPVVRRRIDGRKDLAPLARHVVQSLWAPLVPYDLAFQLRVRERLRDRLRLLGFMGRLSYAEVEWVDLPSFFAPVYFFLKPLRMGSQYLAGRALKTSSGKAHP